VRKENWNTSKILIKIHDKITPKHVFTEGEEQNEYFAENID